MCSLFSRCLTWGFEIAGGTEELKAKQAGVRACKVLWITEWCETWSPALIWTLEITDFSSASALHSSALHSRIQFCIHETQVVSALLSPRGREKIDELVFVRHTVTIAISGTEKLMRKVIAFSADSMQSIRHGDTLWTTKGKNTEQLLIKWAPSILCAGWGKGPVECYVIVKSTVVFQHTHTGNLNPGISNFWRPGFEIFLVRTETVRYIVTQIIKVEIPCCSIKLIHIIWHTLVPYTDLCYLDQGNNWLQ